MSANTLPASYGVVLAVLLLCSGSWLASRGRKVGFFFAAVAVVCFFVTKGGAA
jgi:hypothetical protein